MERHRTVDILAPEYSRKGERWTPEEDAELARLYSTMPVERLAEILGRTGDAIRTCAAEKASAK
jgi:hypothetical protein